MSLASTLAACQQEPAAPSGPKLLPLSGPVAEANGRLVYVKSKGLWTLEPSTGAVQQLVAFPAGAFGGAPAVSPDGKLVAYSLYRPSSVAKDPGGTDLFVVGADGSNPQLLLAHQTLGEALGDPTWAPDGQSIYFTDSGPQIGTRIERARVDGSGREVVVQSGQSPSVAADGRLAYVAADARTNTRSIWLAEGDGKNARQLVGAPEFRDLAAPRFAPDGQRLVVSGVPSGTGTPQPRSEVLPALEWGPKTAHAHGIPWDLWLVDLEGGGLQQITDLEEDSPIAIWSADGQWIAFSGELGLYLVDAEGKQVRRIAEEGAGGGLAWLPQ